MGCYRNSVNKAKVNEPSLIRRLPLRHYHQHKSECCWVSNLSGDPSVGVALTVIFWISCILFLRRSLIFGTSEVVVTSTASGRMSSCKSTKTDIKMSPYKWNKKNQLKERNLQSLFLWFRRFSFFRRFL
jgi:hypothetical protein